MTSRILRASLVLASMLMAVSCAKKEAVVAKADAGLDRTVLPIHEPTPPVYKELDARDAKAPPRFEVKAPAGAPNVVIVLIDDIGFGASSAFGGPIHMPTLEKMAANGLRYNRFHTTALCSPTRVALLTGRNHHINNAGAIMELATGFPGNTGIRPGSVTPLAQILRMNGYSTAAFGKYHETPPWEVSTSGPFDRWPTGSGFDKFYGFIGGETNQWAPAIFDGVTRVEHDMSPNYHFTTDMTNQAIKWVSAQHSLTPDKPFYVYFATGATHAPHHAPKEWIAKYKGQFAGGWDKLREETYARQKEMGIIPADTKLTPRPKEIPAWDDMNADQKRLFERQMETFAGFAEHTDHEVGRLVEQLDALGELDNTLFFYIVGDNGASAEGGPEGAYNEMMALNGIAGTYDQMKDHVDDWGGPTTFPHYAIGWAWATNAPFQWTKQIASHFGGTRNGMVLQWPSHIKAKGEIRSQFHHVIDVAPTALEAAGIPEPKTVNGIEQYPMDGVSMLYTTDDAKAADRRKTQYFEMFGNRAIYHEGWIAATRHSIPWVLTKNPPLKDDVWELYNIDKDFSEADNLAAKNPEKLKELQDLFMQEAERNHVLPIDDRRSERFNPAIAGRPDLLGGRHHDDGLRRHDRHHGKRLHQREGRASLHHGRSRASGLEDGGRDHRAGRLLRRLVALHEGRPRGSRLQLLRAHAHEGRIEGAAFGRQAHDRVRVHPGRGEARHRRQVDDQRRRPARRRGPHREDPAVRLLGRRRRGRRRRQRDDGLRRLQAGRHGLQGRDRQGDRRPALRRIDRAKKCARCRKAAGAFF